MKDLIHSITMNTVLFAVAAVFATKAYKWIAPILKFRDTEPAAGKALRDRAESCCKI